MNTSRPYTFQAKILFDHPDSVNQGLPQYEARRQQGIYRSVGHHLHLTETLDSIQNLEKSLNIDHILPSIMMILCQTLVIETTHATVTELISNVTI